MKLTKDVYEYLLNFADDRDVLNMLSVNKKFRDEEFFQRFMKRRYLELVKYKYENETWKKFFIKMIYYIAKLQEEFEISYKYIKTNPEIFYKKHHKEEDIYSYAMVLTGNNPDINTEDLIDFIKLMVNKGANVNNAVGIAVSRNRFDIAKNFHIEKGAEFYIARYIAAKEGNINGLKFIFEYDGNAMVDSSLEVAAKFGQLETVKFLVEQGDVRFHTAIMLARQGGHLHVVEYLETLI